MHSNNSYGSKGICKLTKLVQACISTSARRPKASMEPAHEGGMHAVASARASHAPGVFRPVKRTAKCGQGGD